MRREWTIEEEKYIKENGNILSWSKMAKHLGCSISTVQNKAEKLGIEVNHTKTVRWTKEEVKLLREYSTKYITKTIAKKLNKSVVAIQKKAIKEGIILHGQRDIWKKWMIDYLKDNIDNKSIRQIALFLEISEHQVRKKCDELSLNYTSNRWTKEEEDILINNADKCHYSELTKLLPGKSKSAILCKARSMNINIITEVNNNISEDTIKFIVDNWGKISINEMSRKLRVPRSTIYIYKEKYNLPNIGQNIKWSEDTIKELEKLAKTKSREELAKHFKTSKAGISSIASRHNIKLIDSKKVWTENKINKIIELSKNHTTNEISVIMDISTQTLNKIIKRYNIDVKKDNMKNLWTDEEINLLKSMENKSIIDIMKVIDKTDDSIISMCKKLNLSYIEFSSKSWTDEEIENLKKDAAILNIKELVIKYNRSSSAIRMKLSKYNITPISLINNWSNEEVEILKELVNQGKNITYISKELNRTPASIKNKMKKENLKLKTNKKFWTKEEEKLLSELWYEHNINYIAKKLDRSISSIINKAFNLNLGKQFLHSDALRFDEIAEIFNVRRNDIDTTWIILGLPYKTNRISKNKSYKYVEIDDLFNFLENNQFLYDGKDFEENILGIEPKWVKEKRKHDFFYGFDYKNSNLKKKQLLQEKKYYLDELEQTDSIKLILKPSQK